MSAKDGVVHLWDLPQKEVYLDLERRYKMRMLNTARSLAGNWNNFVKAIGKKRSFIYNMLSNQKVSLKDIIKISDFLVSNGFDDYKLEIIEKKVILLGTKSGNGTIVKPNLPFNFTNENATTFLAAIFFDGGMVHDLKPYYGNTYQSHRTRIKKCAERIFGKINNKESTPSRGFMLRFPKILGIIIHTLGIKPGEKVFTNPSLPEFIFNLNFKAKCSFLRQAFDDDGWVSPSREIGMCISVDISKLNGANREKIIKNSDIKHAPNLLLDIKRLLTQFTILVHGPRIRRIRLIQKSRNKIGSFCRLDWIINISDRRSIENFAKFIGFNLKYKQKELEVLVNSYQKYQLPKGMINKIAFEKAREITKIKGFFTKHMLAKSLGYNYSYVARIIRKFKAKGLIEEIGHRGERQPVKFVIKL
jgi:hypothetical protein